MEILKMAAFCCLGLMIALPALAQEDGATIYKSKCARCHGSDGMSHTFEGKMTKAAQFSSDDVMKMSDPDLVAVVKNGKKKMPGFAKKLTDDQINAVVAYVHTLQQQTPPAK